MTRAINPLVVIVVILNLTTSAMLDGPFSKL